MEGRAAALGAGTVLNALATGTGAAFGIDVETRATVTLNPDADGVRGTIAEDPDGDTALIEHCVALATERWGDGEGGTVRTDSDVPLAAGLKSSSAAANATVLATCDALGLAVGDDDADPSVDVTRLDACRLGVERPARRASRSRARSTTRPLRCSAASPLPTTTPTSYGRARPSTGTFSCGRLPSAPTARTRM